MVNTIKERNVVQPSLSFRKVFFLDAIDVSQHALAIVIFSCIFVWPTFLGIPIGGGKVGVLYVLLMLFGLLCAISFFMRNDGVYSLRSLVRRNPVFFLLFSAALLLETVSMFMGGPSSWTIWFRNILGFRVMFLAGLFLGATRLRLEYILKLFAALILLNGLLVIFESSTHILVNQLIYELFPVDDFRAISNGTIRNGNFRCMALFMHPIALGIYSGVSLPVFMALAKNARSVAGRFLYIFGFGVSCFAAYESFSRSALFVGAFSVVVYLLLDAYRDHVRRGSKRIYALIVAVGFGLVVALPKLLALVRGATMNEAASSAIRDIMWLKGLPHILASPLLGWGYGSDVNYAGVSLGVVGQYSVDDSYLSMLLNVGAVGMLLFFAALFWAVLKVYRTLPHMRNGNAARYLICIIAALLGIALGQKVNSVYYYFYAFYFLFGVLAACPLVRGNTPFVRKKTNAEAENF